MAFHCGGKFSIYWALFCQVDDHLAGLPKHPEAHLWPREVVTLGLLHALKGVGNRPFSRWLTRDYRALFPRLPERTRLFRLFATHQDWTRVFLAAPTVLGVIDTYGIELIHPMREGRSPQQIGRKGLSNHRWIVGGKLCLLLNQWGLIVGWACATANVADQTFQWLIRQVDGRMIVLSDTGFHAAEGDPTNLKVCPRGEWQDRMLVETVLSMLTVVAGSGKRDYSRSLPSEPDVKVSLHPAQASQRPCEGPVSIRKTCWLHDTSHASIPLRGK